MSDPAVPDWNESHPATVQGGGPWPFLAVLAVLLLAGVGWAGWMTWDRLTMPTVEEIDRLSRARQYQAADRAARRYVAAHPRDARGLFALARAREEKGDLLGSARALEGVPEDSIRRTEALYRAGKAYRKLNRGRDAERLFTQCVLRDPAGQTFSMNARLELLALYAMEEQVERFKDLVRETLGLLPEASRLPVLVMRMRIEYEQVRPDINAKPLRALLAADPGDVGARRGLAAALDRAGDTGAALALYQESLAARPDDLELRERLLDLLHRLGKFPALQEALRGRPRGSDDRPAMRKFLGIEAETKGDLEAALAHFRAAAAAEPSEPEYHHRLSQLLFRMGRKEEAAREAAERARLRKAHDDLRKAWDRFADAYEARPGAPDPALLLGMARACEGCGWNREALAWFRQTLLVAPRDAEARAGAIRLQRDEAS